MVQITDTVNNKLGAVAKHTISGHPDITGIQLSFDAPYATPPRLGVPQLAFVYSNGEEVGELDLLSKKLEKAGHRTSLKSGPNKVMIDGNGGINEAKFAHICGTVGIPYNLTQKLWQDYSAIVSKYSSEQHSIEAVELSRNNQPVLN